jgi:hypothetical protein
MPGMSLKWLAAYPNRFGILLGMLIPAMLFSEFFTSLFILFIFVNFFFHHFWKDAGHLLRNPLLLLFLAFFLIQVVGYYITQESMRDAALRKMETKLPFVLVPLFFAGGLARLSKAWLNGMLWIIALANAVALLFCFLFAAWQVATTGSWHSTWSDGSIRDYYFLYSGLSDVLMHPGYLATFAGGGFFAAIWLLHRQIYTALWQKRVLIGSCLLLAIGILMLQSRINILGFLLIMGFGAGVAILKMPEWRKPFIGISAAGTILLALVLFIPSPLSKRFLGLTDFEYQIDAPSMNDFTGITIRLAEWDCVRETISRYGFWGTGQGSAQPALRAVYEEKNFKMGLHHDFNAHNQYYETRLANGIPGLMVLLSLFGFCIIVAIKQKNWLLLAFAAYWMMTMCAESMLERQKGVILCCIYLPIFYQLGTIFNKGVDTKKQEA